MGYQATAQCRFYVNLPEWMAFNGYMSIAPVFRTLPVKLSASPYNWGEDISDGYNPGELGGIAGTDNHYIAFLGHTCSEISVDTFSDNIINGDFPNNQSLDFGYSMCYTYNYPQQIWANGHISSILVGNYYTMPHSPDLSLTMTREYGGTKTTETKGGASLSNTMWTKPASWGGIPSWDLTTGTATSDPSPTATRDVLSRSGRRIWDLSFSFLGGSDMFGPNQSIGIDAWGNQQGQVDSGALEQGDVNVDSKLFDTDILKDDNFYSQVVHKTAGGQLAFIFQPDINDLNMALAKFDQNSFQFKLVANGVYNCKIKIREVW